MIARCELRDEGTPLPRRPQAEQRRPARPRRPCLRPSGKAQGGDPVPELTTPRFLVTGAHGCIGAWVVHELLAAGHHVTTFDLSRDPRRLRLLLDEATLATVPHVAGDITDLAQLEQVLDEHAITNVIHL